jgi:fructose-1,6-bisphosphatase/inositol monophosphatase family enzyme
MNGAPILVNKINEMSEAYIGASGSRSNTVRAAEFKAAVINGAYRPVMLNCVIYEAMLVATGQMAATVCLGFGAHDVAASKLIVEEAGGKVTNVFGEEQRYDQAVKGGIVSNGAIHDKLIKLADEYKM